MYCGAQALSAATEASPGIPVLVLEDDVQVASFFALRVSKLITDIEVRKHTVPSAGVGTCLPHEVRAERDKARCTVSTLP